MLCNNTTLSYLNGKKYVVVIELVIIYIYTEEWGGGGAESKRPENNYTQLGDLFANLGIFVCNKTL